jgi:hypothetical protein
VRPSSVRRPAVPSVVVAAVLAVVAVACQGGGPSDADGSAATAPDEAEGPDDGSADVEPDRDADDADVADEADDADDDAAPEGTPDDADADGAEPEGGEGAREPEEDEADPEADAGPREALAFTARSLEGGEVDVAALTDGPVLLWMWAPW